MTSNYRSKSSNRWLKQHFQDSYVLQAHKKKLFSRAWFKLHEIDKNYKIFKLGMNIIDLGSSPGGWSQYAIKKIGLNGRVFACDIQPMRPIKNVKFLQSDFTKKNTFDTLLDKFSGKIHTCISDISPNITGISLIDIPKIFDLANHALKKCKKYVIPGGNFVVKVFQGNEFREFFLKIKELFNFIKIKKPHSSKSSSREIYIIAKDKKL